MEGHQGDPLLGTGRGVDGGEERGLGEGVAGFDPVDFMERYADAAWEQDAPVPDVTFEDRMGFRAGDLEVELLHAPGVFFSPTRNQVPQQYSLESTISGIPQARFWGDESPLDAGDDFVTATDAELRELAGRVANWSEPDFAGVAKARDALCHRLGRRLERAGHRSLALDVYRAGESTACSERVVRLLLGTDRKSEARTFLERCIAEPRNDEERLFAEDLYAR